jgi:cell surface protein SprA
MFRPSACAAFDFQFNVRTGGVVADRVFVNVDYDSQREFDASNNISERYQGKTD